MPVTPEYNEFVAKTQLNEQLNKKEAVGPTKVVKIVPQKLEGTQATAHPFKGFLPSDAITRWVRIKKLDVNAYARLNNNQMAAIKLTGEAIYPKTAFSYSCGTGF